MKLVNMNVVPPFFWINQWRPFFRCCWCHPFDLLSVRYSRDREGGLNVSIVVVVLGFGFCFTWWDRIERAKYLANMDQLDEHVKEMVREATGRPKLFREDDDA